MIPKTNLRPPLVQALNVEVPKHTQKDEYIHSNPIDTHNMEQEFLKKKVIQMQKIVSVFLIWRAQGFITIGKCL